MVNQMRIYKEKQYLIFNYEDGRTVKYDFATKTAIGIKGKPVKDLRRQLRYYTLDELYECFDDKKYANFLKFIRRSEYNCISNIGSILDKVPLYSKFEQIFSAGIDDIINDGKYFKYTINELPKSLIKLCKEHEIKLSNNIVGYFIDNPAAYLIAYDLDFLSLTDTDILTVWKKEKNIDRLNNTYQSCFGNLINNFGYRAKDLWLYIDRIKTFEAIEDMNYLLTELCDYANMMKQLSPKYDKYPRNLLTTHRIACRNYNRMKKEFSEEMFKKRINKQYECSFGDYIFIYPKSTQDIKDEAVSQNNCVASYIDKVIDGKCHILFLRKKNKPDDSLVTIEVRDDRIVQARRRFNDPVTDEDQIAIDSFNKKFEKKEKKVA